MKLARAGSTRANSLARFTRLMGSAPSDAGDDSLGIGFNCPGKAGVRDLDEFDRASADRALVSPQPPLWALVEPASPHIRRGQRLPLKQSIAISCCAPSN